MVESCGVYIYIGLYCIYYIGTRKSTHQRCINWSWVKIAPPQGSQDICPAGAAVAGDLRGEMEAFQHWQSWLFSQRSRQTRGRFRPIPQESIDPRQFAYETSLNFVWVSVWAVHAGDLGYNLSLGHQRDDDPTCVVWLVWMCDSHVHHMWSIIMFDMCKMHMHETNVGIYTWYVL